jgi:hypothetical protein
VQLPLKNCAFRYWLEADDASKYERRAARTAGQLEKLIDRLMEGVRRQLRSEGVAPGTPITMLQWRQAFLRSEPEIIEIAHQLYELPYMEPEKGQILPCGLKEIASSEVDNAVHPETS